MGGFEISKNEDVEPIKSETGPEKAEKKSRIGSLIKRAGIVMAVVGSLGAASAEKGHAVSLGELDLPSVTGLSEMSSDAYFEGADTLEELTVDLNRITVELQAAVNNIDSFDLTVYGRANDAMRAYLGELKLQEVQLDFSSKPEDGGVAYNEARDKAGRAFEEMNGALEALSSALGVTDADVERLGF